MDNNELTSAQIARRKYEQKHKKERQLLNAKFCTTVPRKFNDKLNEFLERHKISKVDLIYAGFDALVEKYEKPQQE